MVLLEALLRRRLLLLPVVSHGSASSTLLELVLGWAILIVRICREVATVLLRWLLLLAIRPLLRRRFLIIRGVCRHA